MELCKNHRISQPAAPRRLRNGRETAVKSGLGGALRAGNGATFCVERGLESQDTVAAILNCFVHSDHSATRWASGRKSSFFRALREA